KVADFDFVELSVWRKTVLATLAGDGLALLDVDEQRNRLRLGFAPGADRASPVAKLLRAGVPQAALYLEPAPRQAPPASSTGQRGWPFERLEYRLVSQDTPTLRDPIRPLAAGTQIYMGMENYCTLAFLVSRPDSTDHGYALTAGHCSP